MKAARSSRGFLHEETYMKEIKIPVWEKFTLSIGEASVYFGIGEDRIRSLCKHDYSFVLHIGNHIRIKRELFEKFLTSTDYI